MLIGLRRLRQTTGCGAVLFYLVIYYLMNLGAFLVVMLVANATGREDIDGFRGLAWRGGALPAVAMAIFLFSLTGLPPLAGLRRQVLPLRRRRSRRQLYVLGRRSAVLNSVVSLYYYARVVKTMFLDQPGPGDAARRLPARRPRRRRRRCRSRRRSSSIQFGWLLRTVEAAAGCFGDSVVPVRGWGGGCRLRSASSLHARLEPRRPPVGRGRARGAAESLRRQPPPTRRG